MKYPEKFNHLLFEKDGQYFIDQELLYRKCLAWSKAELQMKIKHYPMIILAVTDSIHSTMLRALNGQERESLRKYMNIHQSINTPTFPEQKSMLGGLFSRK